MRVRALIEKSWLRWAVAGLAGLALLYGALSWPRWQLRAAMATGYGARMTCACRYIEGRDMKSCRGDFAGLEGMGLVRLADDPAQRKVRASIPLLARREAQFKPGFGCMPDRF
jgi:hypothetical protein